MSYLRNAWYVAAVDEELTAGEQARPLARTIMDEPVVLWRKRDGAVAAIEDRCCHRHLPLSLGAVLGEHIRCGYHGLEYDAAGKVVVIPGQLHIPSTAQVKTYRVIEKWNFIWIWMGEAALADETLIPNVFWADHPQWKFTRQAVQHLKCDYRLIADNVLDATHLTYVHASTIGASSITEIEPAVEYSPDHVRVSRWMLNRPPPPAYAKAGGFTGNADRLAAIEYRVPNFCVNFANCYDPGCGGPDGDIAKSGHSIELVAISLPTPETATTCHYFFAFARSFGFDDPQTEQFFGPGMRKVFEEDFVILEAQQARMNAFPDAPQIDIKVDLGPNLHRRILARRIEAERLAQASAAQ
ncbi:MAG: aromatic ring-hydroxylating dioxygenase subunit alpha [Alphaproteobacteria bacterium]|nr:aromatic ring-hydroxylating dioxygenase subunit alpha [Alphaproteobacteria bacterium]